jgi:type II restriction/modification system DNA methylase subunit YeeA
LDGEDIALVRRAADRDWSDIDTSIFGTLFERGLDPDKRSQLGAHYTDRAKIMMIVEPVIIQPWISEWQQVKATIVALNPKVEGLRKSRSPSRQTDLATATYQSFLKRLRAFRVLDPACGSGNFLYLALLALKDLERQVNIEAEAMGMARESPQIGPEAVRGIEVNPYAADLARMTVWIGEIQWMRRNGFDVSREPILKPLDTIECRDAILNEDGSEAQWPEVDVVIGNPPFLGQRFMRRDLGSRYVDIIRDRYHEIITGNADFVVYWFLRAEALMSAGSVRRVGLVATNSIRGGDNQTILRRIFEGHRIFCAHSDEPWVNAGAAVRVSIICFEHKTASSPVYLNGQASAVIGPMLSGDAESTHAAPVRILGNAGIAFAGFQANGPFDIAGETARTWLLAPMNPNGMSNADVLRPIINAADLVRRNRDEWVVDFGERTEANAALYELPFSYLLHHVKPARQLKREAHLSRHWWLHKRISPNMRAAIRRMERFLATPMVSKYRLFRWLQPTQIPENACIVFARDDDGFFGILHSRFHEAWSLRFGTSLEDRPRYTPSTTFETFPFPDGLTPNIPASAYANDPRAVKIADAAKRLNYL